MERELFLEIGLEEVPASWLPGLTAQLTEKMAAQLAAVNLKYSGTIEAFSTPRRLAVVVPALADRQEDRDEKLMGPPVSAGLTKDGQPTPALIGFAKKQNVDVSELKQEDTPKGRYFTLERQIRGKATVDVVPDIIGGLLRDLSFPKMMHWDAELPDGKGELLFGRPIRWLLYLYGGRVVPYSVTRTQAAASAKVNEISTGAVTYGHRFLATSGRPGRAIKVRSFEEYRKKLAEQFVILSRDERRDRIRRELEGAARKLQGHALIKGYPQAEHLLEEVPDLVEYPSVVAGSFSPMFLELPSEVLITTLIHHQHYFPVGDAQGRLMPHFLAIVNTQPSSDRAIAINAERVVTARLRDARFFWDSDRRVGLEARRARLDTVLFHKALGSYGDKAARISQLARRIATDVFRQSESVAASAARAAELCKADLASDMVGEFPELQGVMGGIYAREAGEPEAVWKAIYHHYLPVGVEADAAPAAAALGDARATWAAVALADKLDTLAGLFRAGEKPTGSRDPFGMRRAAQGVMKILADAGEFGLPGADVRALMDQAWQQYAALGGEATPGPAVMDFMKERLVHLLDKRGAPADAAAVVAAHWHRPDLAVQRATAVAAELARPDSELRKLAELYKRAANITKGVAETTADLAALSVTEPAEVALRDELMRAVPAAEAAAAAGDYAGAIRTLVALRPAVDRFFTDVMVMVDDAAVKETRLALVARLRDAIAANIGDLSQMNAV